MNILYVEDDPGNAELTQRELRRSAPHFHVDIVTTQQEALDRLNQTSEDYDLVLTDLRLPDGDGLTLLKHIRERALPLAVVVITGQGDEETAVNVLKAGADDYIVKRQDYLARLSMTLENALYLHRAEATRRAHPLRVLYAEHHATDIGLTRRHLKHYAPYIHLDVVNSATEVLHRLATNEPLTYEILLLDFRLPGLNALELLKELRQTYNLDIPVVLVTGQGDEEVAIQALKLGASDYVMKNIGYLYQLPSVLENAFYRAQLSREQLALRESEERLRKIVENMPVLFDAFDENGVALFWNTECERVTGYTAEEIVGNPQAMELLVPDPEYRVEILRQLQALGHYYRDWELEVTCKDGNTRTIAWSNISREYPIPGWWSWGIGVDVTERKRAERALKEYSEQLEEMVAERTNALKEAQEQLIRREKLAVLGQLAGGVGHELRNPLGVISNATYYLNMIFAEVDEETKEYLELISTEVRNAEKIISDLLDFARIKSVDKMETIVSDLVEHVLENQPLPEGVHVMTDIPANFPAIFVDPRQMEQVLGNLIVNAYQAMPEGGQLTICAQTEQDRVVISVSDTGCGISEKNLKKLFEPLFTTKARGIGLGLAVSQNLVEANGGSIEVKSEEGNGSTFTLMLPTEERFSSRSP